jgi:hypothetical protein
MQSTRYREEGGMHIQPLSFVSTKRCGVVMHESFVVALNHEVMMGRLVSKLNVDTGDVDLMWPGYEGSVTMKWHDDIPRIYVANPGSATERCVESLVEHCAHLDCYWFSNGSSTLCVHSVEPISTSKAWMRLIEVPATEIIASVFRFPLLISRLDTTHGYELIKSPTADLMYAELRVHLPRGQHYIEATFYEEHPTTVVELHPSVTGTAEMLDRIKTEVLDKRRRMDMIGYSESSSGKWFVRMRFQQLADVEALLHVIGLITALQPMA